jgi:predicted XRE-type DNA-binding protein
MAEIEMDSKLGFNILSDMTVEPNKLRDLIVEFQEKSGLTQAEFSTIVGIKQASYNYFVNNPVKELDINRVNDYATALGLSFTQLIDIYKIRYENESESPESLWRKIEIMMEVYKQKSKK